MVQAYIFDQDGTLYPEQSRLTEILREHTKQWLSRALNLTRGQVEGLYMFLMEKYPNPFDGFNYLGLSVEDYHNEVFNKVDPSQFLERDEMLIRLLESLKTPKFVVTFASRSYSHNLQIALGIDALIEETVLVSDFYPNNSKLSAYKRVCDKVRTEPSEVLVVGNNFATDILPALFHGYKTMLIGERRTDYDGKVVSSLYEIPK